uniref:beta-galactosidase n=1 Tax=Ananas comosus var. bracteatus TaxID=296719 RepID=A0A6V7PI44_ANACO|nr:unnamed protein product [Ananas comosus var. bracteatus]
MHATEGSVETVSLGTKHPSKPLLWTENWTAQVFGDPPSQRLADDLAFSVARFFSKIGTLVNYYMGTNFGRTGAAFVMTRYYDEAPLDEYGLYKEPKCGHLRDLHHVLRLSRKDAQVKFRGVEYFLPRHSVRSAHAVKLAKKFVFQNAMDLKAGINHLALLFLTVGMPDSGAGLEKKYSGIDEVMIQGLNTGTLDLTVNGWGHEVGLSGEKLGIHSEEGSSCVQWQRLKRYFDAPTGNDPVALDMSSMGNGLVWINGECIWRYWVSYLSPLGQPSQSVYHIPQAFLRLKNNLMVMFEEHGGRLGDISIVTVKRDNICIFVSEYHPAHIKSWARQDSQIRVIAIDVKPSATLKCPEKKVINQIVFASFGSLMGVCGNFTVGNCHTPQAKILVEKLCLGKRSCTLPVSHQAYGTDLNCPGTTGTLAVKAKCSRRNAKANPSR